MQEVEFTGDDLEHNVVWNQATLRYNVLRLPSDLCPSGLVSVLHSASQQLRTLPGYAASGDPQPTARECRIF